ncbi:MAG: discoidin domain-containing protein, partial [Gemmatimonadales bacterium]
HPPAAILDGNAATSWRPDRGPSTVTVDFLRPREFGGLSITWDSTRRAGAYTVSTSDDGHAWRWVESRMGGIGAVDHLYLPDSEARYLRIATERRESPTHPGIVDVVIHPAEGFSSHNQFMAMVARSARRGLYPRYFLGERANWTVVGVDRAREEALIDEDGVIEAGLGSFRVEPFVRVGSELLTWADVRRTRALHQDRLPIPQVSWHATALRLDITAFALGPDTASSLIGRYRIHNTSGARLRGALHLALRPFQVNPPWQFLGVPGGTAAVELMVPGPAGIRASVNREVGAVTPNSRTVMVRGADIVEYLLRDSPVTRRGGSFLGPPSAALTWDIDIGPGDSATVVIEIPLVAGGSRRLSAHHAVAIDSVLDKVAAGWSAAVDRATITLPGDGAQISNTIATVIAHILINRDGPAIQPGSRSYERSWIRDGALTSAALLRFGHADAVREFIEWYAKFQYADGKIPCCVDARGPDPVPEHDSHGEFIYLVMEYFRHTGDRGMLARMWPHVAGAAAYMDSLRQIPVTDTMFRGLLPPSISHEGYSAKAMHSYWDDFFALRGFKDAATMATILGQGDDAQRLARIRDAFARDLYSSIETAMVRHRIDFIPGAADIGDFDATSTTIAVSPGGELERLPRAALDRTFERYWSEAMARRDSASTWEAYTPYELRTVGTMLRLGHTDRALALLTDFMDDREPREWNQWPEVVYRADRAPRFIGDMPHTWVGSDFLRSVAELFAYERESDSALVVGAGIADAWLDGSGTAVHQLGTWWGKLSYTVQRVGSRTTMRIAAGITVPPGGVVVQLPGIDRGGVVMVNGVSAPATAAGTVVVRSLPAVVEVTR